MKKKLFTLPDELVAKVEGERNGNQSKVVAEALRMYYERKAAEKEILSNLKKIIELLDTRPVEVEKTEAQRLQEKLIETRTLHPDWVVEIKDGVVCAWHRGRRFWQDVDEIEEY